MPSTGRTIVTFFLLTSVCLSVETSAQAPVPVVPYVAEAKAVVEIAKDIYDFFKGTNNDIAQMQQDVKWIKEKLGQMDAKLDSIATAVNKLPGFITEKFDDEARKNSQTMIKNVYDEYPEWSSDPALNRTAISTAYNDLHKTALNMISRKPYSDYNLLAVSMALESKLRGLNKRNTPVAPVFSSYADFFDKAVSPTEPGSLASYRDGLKKQIADLQARHAGYHGVTLCPFASPGGACDAPNRRCMITLSKKVFGSLETGYHEDGSDAFYLDRCVPDPSCTAPSYYSGPNYPMKGAQIGCAILGGGRAGPDLNAEHENYLQLLGALQTAEVALSSAKGFRCQAAFLAGKSSVVCPASIDYGSDVGSDGTKAVPAAQK